MCSSPTRLSMRQRTCYGNRRPMQRRPPHRRWPWLRLAWAALARRCSRSRAMMVRGSGSLPPSIWGRSWQRRQLESYRHARKTPQAATASQLHTNLLGFANPTMPRGFALHLETSRNIDLPFRSPLARPTPGGFIAPCLLVPRPTAPDGPQWVHEIKHDGYRFIGLSAD